jgi:putative hydroxymethylpyrimidine transporter CytX
MKNHIYSSVSFQYYSWSKRMKKSAMALLWMGAAISISEVLTGGLLSSLGLARGLVAVFVGHIIGAVILGIGGYISFSRKENAMDSVAFSLGKTGGKLVALCNVTQLLGWIIILVVEAVSAITLVLPALPFWAAALGLSVFEVLWALVFGSPGGRINDIAVALLAVLCTLLFIEAARGISGAAGFSGAMTMNITLGIELSIAMPVSWLPLVGDYSSQADSKLCAAGMPFIGYFTGSCLMYIIGLCIGISNGGDVFAFIAGSRFRYAACVVLLLSTITTNFIAIYSAALSSGKLIKIKSRRVRIIVIGVFTALVSAFFPAERFNDSLTAFLTAIGTVFIPVYTAVFLEYFLKRQRFEKSINWGMVIIALIGMIGYRIFSVYEILIPTVMTILLVGVLCIIKMYASKAVPGLR